MPKPKLEAGRCLIIIGTEGHLRADTPAENVDDMFRRFRFSTPDVLTPSTIPGILAFYAAGMPLKDIAQVISIRQQEAKKWLRQGLRELAQGAQKVAA